LLLHRAVWWCPKGFPMHDRCLLFILLTCQRDYPACDVGAQFTFLQLALLLCFAPLSLAPRSAACASRSGCATQHRPRICTGTRSYTDSISNVFFFFLFLRYWTQKQRTEKELKTFFFIIFFFVVVAALYRLLYYNGGKKPSAWLEM